MSELSSDKNNLEIGRILINRHYYTKYVVCEKSPAHPMFPAYGSRYKSLDLETLKYIFHDARFLYWDGDGIGIRVEILNQIFEGDLDELIKIADQKVLEDEARKDKAKKENDLLIEKGSVLWAAHCPSYAKAVIVAEHDVDECDSMTDYFSTSVSERVVLGFSTHTKDSFAEMRKFATVIPETSHLTENNKEWEHREKYSMGHGYYLKRGGRYSTGWLIRKKKIYKPDEFYLSLGKRCIFSDQATNKLDTGRREESVSCVEYSEYKGNPIISLQVNGKPFSFGISKAAAVLEHFEDIKRFVESNRKD